MENENQIKVKSLYKALKLLDYFTEDTPEWGITELANQSGVLKSTVYNILATYEVCGILEQDKQTNKYHLGLKILELSNQMYKNNDIQKIMHTYMEEIVRETGENTYMAKFYGDQIIYIDAAFPKNTISGRNMVGIRADAYCTGIGKVLLAYQKSEVLEHVIEKGLKSYTDTTIIKPDQLRGEMENIRKKGYAVDNMEHEYGIRCVAVPIFNCEDQVVAAWSLSGPSLRFTDEKIEHYASLLKTNVEEVKYRIR